MFKLFLFVTFFVSLPLLGASQNCSSDQINTVKSCYLKYLKSYGFDLIPTYNYYANAQDQYRVHGWNGELYICKAGELLISCIGSNDVCVTVDIFTQISGLTDSTSAVEYVIDFRGMKYRCSGDGFTEFKDTYQCLEQLKDCPGTPNNCTEAITYIQCMEEQAYKLCGSEARDFVCNVFDISVNVFLSCPTLAKCSKTKAEQ